MCGEIVRVMPLAQATVSQHLEVLEEVGSIRGTIDGRRSCHCIDRQAVARLRRRLDALRGAWTVPEGEGGRTSEADAIRERVRASYAAIAGAASTGCCGPSSAGCCADGSLDMIGDAYRPVADHLPEADLGLGCGLPTRHAGLRSGETGLDLGCGAGNDVFVARHEVGKTGRVVGVDTTPAMIARARADAQKLGFDDVEFRLGEVEHLPVESGTIDCVISKCVSNLVPDKARAFAEIARVSKPSGRLCVSDVVATGQLPQAIREAAALWAGCVAGAVPLADYLRLVAAAGLEKVRIAEARPTPLPDSVLAANRDAAGIAAFRASGVELRSVTLLARRPHRPAIGPLLTERQGKPVTLGRNEDRRAFVMAVPRPLGAESPLPPGIDRLRWGERPALDPAARSLVAGLCDAVEGEVVTLTRRLGACHAAVRAALAQLLREARRAERALLAVARRIADDLQSWWVDPGGRLGSGSLDGSAAAEPIEGDPGHARQVLDLHLRREPRLVAAQLFAADGTELAARLPEEGGPPREPPPELPGRGALRCRVVPPPAHAPIDRAWIRIEAEVGDAARTLGTLRLYARA
ncbi:MAG: arsenite methyltransferase [Geminicoccaceae bacterium]|nr:arsenite methyltransferase [Geminicoccaceae bacterium]